MYTLSIYREYVPVSLAEAFVCGGVSNEFVYQAEIKATSLDRRGFVLDVKELIAFVKSEFERDTWKASCEELAAGVTRAILGFATAAGVDLEATTVKVFNLTGHVELTWDKSQESPAFPRKASSRERQVKRTTRSAC